MCGPARVCVCVTAVVVIVRTNDNVVNLLQRTEKIIGGRTAQICVSDCRRCGAHITANDNRQILLRSRCIYREGAHWSQHQFAYLVYLHTLLSTHPFLVKFEINGSTVSIAAICLCVCHFTVDLYCFVLSPKIFFGRKSTYWCQAVNASLKIKIKVFEPELKHG